MAIKHAWVRHEPSRPLRTRSKTTDCCGTFKPMAEIPYRDRHRHPYRAAHRHCGRHRTEVLQSDSCRCFYCLATFAPVEIKKWVEEDAQEQGQTEICPK